MRVLTLLAALLLSVPAAGQTVCEVDCHVEHGQPFVVLHTADQATDYTVTVNGTPATLRETLAGGEVEFHFSAGLAAGSYTFRVIAYDGTVQAWVSAPNTLTVDPLAPEPPPTTESPNGTELPPASVIIDSEGAQWTLGGIATTTPLTYGIHRNGVYTGGYGSVLRYQDRKVYTFGADSQWWVWTGTGWAFGSPGTSPPPPDPEPPPPPPPPSGCTTGGVFYPVGATLTQTMHNREVDGWITARQAEGWALVGQAKAKNQTTVTMQCR